jgi:hypothetical protein
MRLRYGADLNEADAIARACAEPALLGRKNDTTPHTLDGSVLSTLFLAFSSVEPGDPHSAEHQHFSHACKTIVAARKMNQPSVRVVQVPSRSKVRMSFSPLLNHLAYMHKQQQEDAPLHPIGMVRDEERTKRAAFALWADDATATATDARARWTLPLRASISSLRSLNAVPWTDVGTQSLRTTQHDLVLTRSFHEFLALPLTDRDRAQHFEVKWRAHLLMDYVTCVWMNLLSVPDYATFLPIHFLHVFDTYLINAHLAGVVLPHHQGKTLSKFTRSHARELLVWFDLVRALVNTMRASASAAPSLWVSTAQAGAGVVREALGTCTGFLQSSVASGCFRKRSQSLLAMGLASWVGRVSVPVEAHEIATGSGASAAAAASSASSAAATGKPVRQVVCLGTPGVLAGDSLGWLTEGCFDFTPPASEHPFVITTFRESTRHNSKSDTIKKLVAHQNKETRPKTQVMMRKMAAASRGTSHVGAAIAGSKRKLEAALAEPASSGSSNAASAAGAAALEANQSASMIDSIHHHFNGFVRPKRGIYVATTADADRGNLEPSRIPLRFDSATSSTRAKGNDVASNFPVMYDVDSSRPGEPLAFQLGHIALDQGRVKPRTTLAIPVACIQNRIGKESNPVTDQYIMMKCHMQMDERPFAHQFVGLEASTSGVLGATYSLLQQSKNSALTFAEGASSYYGRMARLADRSMLGTFVLPAVPVLGGTKTKDQASAVEHDAGDPASRAGRAAAAAAEAAHASYQPIAVNLTHAPTLFNTLILTAPIHRQTKVHNWLLDWMSGAGMWSMVTTAFQQHTDSVRQWRMQPTDRPVAAHASVSDPTGEAAKQLSLLLHDIAMPQSATFAAEDLTNRIKPFETTAPLVYVALQYHTKGAASDPNWGYLVLSSIFAHASAVPRALTAARDCVRSMYGAMSAKMQGWNKLFALIKDYVESMDAQEPIYRALFIYCVYFCERVQQRRERLDAMSANSMQSQLHWFREMIGNHGVCVFLWLKDWIVPHLKNEQPQFTWLAWFKALFPDFTGMTEFDDAERNIADRMRAQWESHETMEAELTMHSPRYHIMASAHHLEDDAEHKDEGVHGLSVPILDFSAFDTTFVTTFAPTTPVALSGRRSPMIDEEKDEQEAIDPRDTIPADMELDLPEMDPAQPPQQQPPQQQPPQQQPPQQQPPQQQPPQQQPPPTDIEEDEADPVGVDIDRAAADNIEQDERDPDWNEIDQDATDLPPAQAATDIAQDEVEPNFADFE